ncbi:MAG: hypothetical protein ABSG69_18385, partial [Candidatus Acidiferrum sp.]
TSTVIANDPYRSLQALPGVSSSGNDDFLAQFSVMGAPYEDVGVYVDDVRVPNLLHTLPGFPDAPSLSLFTGNSVDELRLLPVAYPERYAEDSGAALVITTRTGAEGAPHFHVAVGVADSEFLGEGGFDSPHHGTWLFTARRSYVGYLEHFFDSPGYSDISLFDAAVKFTYDLTPAHTFSLFATGGQTHVSDPSLASSANFMLVQSGENDLAIGRFGWRWQVNPRMLLDTRVSYVRSGYVQSNPTGALLQSSLDREAGMGSILTWNWREGGIVEAGYAIRWPHANDQDNLFSAPGVPPVYGASRFTSHAQNGFLQASQQFWSGRLRLLGGLRWAQESGERLQPFTGTASLFLALRRNTQLEAGWGTYQQLPTIAGGFCTPNSGQLVCSSDLPYESRQYIVAIEQRVGARTRIRIEGFDRENESRADFFLLNSFVPGAPGVLLGRSLLVGRDYSRGAQVVLQRRSENRLSGWIGYTLAYAEVRQVGLSFPLLLSPVTFDSPYGPTLVDQRNSVNLFATFRLTPTVRVSAKNIYGSGFPDNLSPVVRLGAYERLDLRAEKSWLFTRWKLTLYGELLNTTNHFNPVVLQTNFFGTVPPTVQGVPITPTVGLAFDF